MKNQDIKSQLFQNLEQRKCITSGKQPRMFQGRGGFVGLGHFYKHFVRNTREKCSTGKNMDVFSPRYPLNAILIEIFNSKMDTVRAFFIKSGHFFSILTIGQRRPPPHPPLVKRLYLQLLLNILYQSFVAIVTDIVIFTTFRDYNPFCHKSCSIYFQVCVFIFSKNQ